MSTRGLFSLIEKSLKDDALEYKTQPWTVRYRKNYKWITEQTNLKKGWSFSTDNLSKGDLFTLKAPKKRLGIVSRLTGGLSPECQFGLGFGSGERKRANSLDPDWFLNLRGKNQVCYSRQLKSWIIIKGFECP